MAQRPRAKTHSPLSRNILFAGVSLTALAFGSAGLTLFGNNSYAAPAPYVASRDALKLALVDPTAPPVVKRDPRLAIETPSTNVAARDEDQSTVAKSATLPPAPQRVASKPPAPAKEMSAAAREALDTIPFPVPRPEQASSRERIALAFATDYADPETTGSLGKAATEPKAKPAGIALPPAAAKLAAVAPTKAAPPPKPARPLTPHEKLWGGPVKVAALTPSDAMRESQSVATDGLPRAPYDPMTAVYVIGDKKVYMPDGSALEAHSGYGPYMDDVRFAHMRMRGVTPPHVYTMKMRERLFHGVEAIRLTPMHGESAIFGRDGILAHTYLLGPNGQSHGCVSFRNYDAFLQAFKQGKINRLAVIGKLD